MNNALKEELASESVIAKFATTASDGKIYSRFEALESRVDKQQEQLDFLVKTHGTP